MVVVRSLWEKNAKSKVRALYVDHDGLLPLHKGTRSSQHTRDVDVGSETEKNRYANVLSLLFAICIHVPRLLFCILAEHIQEQAENRQDNPSIPYDSAPYNTWIPQRCWTTISEQKGIRITLWQKNISRTNTHNSAWWMRIVTKFRSIKAMRPRGSLFHCLCAQLKLLKVQVA